ncbi:MAG: HEPN domain-containing protein [Acidobacteriota bacterium]|nr:HEPN domain-containing protein [Acidobacteriota bacterium]
MNVAPETLEVLRVWIRKAEHDLEAARRIMATEDGCPYDTVCFHCQQACEKYLKALLTLADVHAPRTHDLEALFTLVPLAIQPEVEVAALSSLNPYAVDVRYADDWREPQRAEAVRALEIARTLRDSARRALPQDAL